MYFILQMLTPLISMNRTWTKLYENFSSQSLVEAHWNGVRSSPIGNVYTIEDVGLDADENLVRMSVKMIAERGKYHIEGSI